MELSQLVYDTEKTEVIMADFRDMLTHASELSGDDAKTASQIIFKVWIDLWIDCGNSRIPILEGEDSDKCTHKLWNRDVFLQRIVEKNNALAVEHMGKDAVSYKIDGIKMLKNKDMHGGQPRITQAFNYARTQVVKALESVEGNGIEAKDVVKRMKQPPLTAKKRNTGAEFLSMLGNAGLKLGKGLKMPSK